MAEHEDPQAIRAGIQQTRARMSDRLDELGERLNPNHIKTQIKDSVRDATIGRAERMARDVGDTVSDTGHGIWDTIRENPIPTAMVGIGLGWLIANRSTSSGRSRAEIRGRGYDRDFYGYDRGGYGLAEGGRYEGYGRGEAEGTLDRMKDRASDMGDTIRDRTSDLADRTRSAVSDAADRAESMAEDVAGRARHFAHDASRSVSDVADRVEWRAERAGDRIGDFVHDNPLAAGAAALALGMAAGMAIPETERENEKLGPARDRLVDSAEDRAREFRDKVEHVADETVQEARHLAGEAKDKLTS